MTHVIKSMKHDSAEYIRDLEYIREMTTTDMLDDNIDHSLEQFEDEVENSSAVEFEATEMVSMMDDDDAFIEEEVNRIIENDSEFMTIDDVMGIEV